MLDLDISQHPALFSSINNTENLHNMFDSHDTQDQEKKNELYINPETLKVELTTIIVILYSDSWAYKGWMQL